MSAAEKERDVVCFEHPTPHLDTLTLESGDEVLYDPDPENPDAWLQTDPCHMIELDGRWR